MPRHLRPIQLSLIAQDLGDWDTITDPRPLGQCSDTNNYEAQWRSYKAAAQTAGWTPVDVAQRGTAALAAELAERNLRHWSPATITRYAKLARYAGLDPQRHPPPTSPQIGNVINANLWRPSAAAASQRNALAAIITWHWPMELPQLLNLAMAAVHATETGALCVEHDNTALRIPSGAEAFLAWQQTRRQWRPNPWLFCTAHTSRTAAPPGAKLSLRGFQASFAQHAALTGHEGLTWKQYRAVAQQADETQLAPS